MTLSKRQKATTGPSTEFTEVRFLETLDPLKSVWLVTALALAIILAYTHIYPQAAYPEFAIIPSVALVLLSLASLLLVVRSPAVQIKTLLPLIPAWLFFLWAFWRTSQAEVPSEGIMLLGTLFQGCIVFTIALILAAVACRWRSFRPDAAAGPKAGKPTNAEQKSASPLFEYGLPGFVILLALGSALYAVYQYYILYDQQFATLYEELITRTGRTYNQLSPQDWRVLEALNSKRVAARFGNPNVLCGFLGMALPLALGAFVLWRERGARAAALATVGLCWFVILLSRSRGGFLTITVATALAGLVLAIGNWKRYRTQLAVAAAAIAVAIILAAAGFGKSSRRLSDDAPPALPTKSYSLIERLFNAPTVAQRLYYLQSGWDMIRESPWLGHGFGAYAVLYPKYIRKGAEETRYPHNIVCQYWVETGLVGLLIWATWIGGVLIAAIFRGWRRRRGPEAIPFRMLLVAVVIFPFNNLFEMTWTFREAHVFWCLLLGILAGLTLGPEEETKAPDETGSNLSLKGRIAPLCFAAVPVILAVVLTNSIVLRPLAARARMATANALLSLPNAIENEPEITRMAYKMLGLQPNSPWTHHWMAMFYQQRGRDREARFEFDKALQLYPESAQIHADYAQFEQRAGSPKKARDLYAKATGLYPLKTDYLYQWAEFERSEGNATGAKDLIEKAINRAVDDRKRARYLEFRRDLLTTETLTTPP